MIVGVPGEIKRDEYRVGLPPVARAVNVYEGELTNRAVAETFDIPYNGRFQC